MTGEHCICVIKTETQFSSPRTHGGNCPNSRIKQRIGQFFATLLHESIETLNVDFYNRATLGRHRVSHPPTLQKKVVPANKVHTGNILSPPPRITNEGSEYRPEVHPFTNHMYNKFDGGSSEKMTLDILFLLFSRPPGRDIFVI